MEPLKVIGWLAWLLLSAVLVYEFVGVRALVQMFPEGRRPWMLPAQLASLAFFAAAAICHPWGWA